MALFPTKYATENKVNQKMTEFYRTRAKGGVGLIVLDCPCLDYPRAYKGPHELRFDQEEYASGLIELINIIHNEGAKVFMQLNYPKERAFGREISGAKKKGVPGIGRCCTVNPFAGLEYLWKVSPASEKKKVIVIGGGPSGMQAAILADQRGHEVELWEQNQLGGQARLAGIAPFKEEVAEVLRYLKHCLDNSGVKLRSGYRAKADDIVSLDPDVVIVATGSREGSPDIPGIGSDPVVFARKIYEQNYDLGKRIVIIGGGDIGCETADWLATPDRQVSIVEILPQVLSRMKKISKERLLSRLSEKRVKIFTETHAISIEKNRINLRRKDGEEFFIEADNVVVAVQAKPEDSLLHELKDKVKDVIAIGDAKMPGNIGSALRSATEAALVI
jgi:NADPH-dependent 2,4-dienoyl-CoA reductase/sulfur reductase-like enzyme